MGLDDFVTDSSTTTTSGGGGGSSSSSGSSSDGPVINDEPDEIRPWFTAVVKEEVETVQTFFKKKAFHRGGRHLDEVFLGCIETEEEFERINQTCKELHGYNLDEFFKKDPFTAADFLDRVTSHKDGAEKVECEVCGNTIIVTEDGYTTVNEDIVCATHTVEEVSEEIELGP